MRLDGCRSDRIGDSFIDGWAVKSDELMTTELSRLTALKVVNLGKASDGPQQELVLLNQYRIPLDPKIVVWAFCEENDLEDLLNYQELVRDRKEQQRTDRSLFGNGPMACSSINLNAI
jgi:hypothetical protein